MPSEAGAILKSERPPVSIGPSASSFAAPAKRRVASGGAAIIALLEAIAAPDSGCRTPAGITQLKESRFVCAWALREAGPDGENVIALRCRPKRARIEQWTYEQLLPRLGLTALRFYGHVVEADGKTHWLFIEDAGGQAFDPHDPGCREAAARWLAAFHVAAALYAPSLPGKILPRQDANYYGAQLSAAIDALRAHRRDPALARFLSQRDFAVIEELLAYCEIAHSKWEQVRQACDRVPLTVVHGDFADRNLRVSAACEKGRQECLPRQNRASEESHKFADAALELIPFDWEDAAWGPPAIDLVQDDADRMYDAASPDLAVYHAAVKAHWPGVDEPAIERLAVIGRLFWQILAIAQDAKNVSPEWTQAPMEHFELYATGLAQVLQMFKWKA